MTKKKTKTSTSTYEVLIPCSNEVTGKEYEAGDTVTDKDFSLPTLISWCEKTPPVVRRKGGNDGGNSQRQG